jgi:hypothetical protein
MFAPSSRAELRTSGATGALARPILPLFSSASPFLLAFPYWPEEVAFLV